MCIFPPLGKSLSRNPRHFSRSGGRNTVAQNFYGYRGTDENALANLLRVDVSEIREDNIGNLRKTVIGKRIVDEGFMSVGIAEGRGFTGMPVSCKVLIKRGQHAMYLEPFSAFGATDSSGHWDGTKTSTRIGRQAEILLQASTRFVVRDISAHRGQIRVTLESLLPDEL